MFLLFKNNELLKWLHSSYTSWEGHRCKYYFVKCYLVGLHQKFQIYDVSVSILKQIYFASIGIYIIIFLTGNFSKAFPLLSSAISWAIDYWKVLFWKFPSDMPSIMNDDRSQNGTSRVLYISIYVCTSLYINLSVFLLGAERCFAPGINLCECFCVCDLRLLSTFPNISERFNSVTLCKLYYKNIHPVLT